MIRKQVELMQSEIKEKIPSLNCGGCIHFAYYFTERLKELKIPYKVYSFNNWATGKTYSTFKSVHHITVYIDRIGFVDGYKTVQHKNKRYKCHIRLKDLNRLRWRSDWNHEYNVNCNQLLEKIINKYIQ